MYLCLEREDFTSSSEERKKNSVCYYSLYDCKYTTLNLLKAAFKSTECRCWPWGQIYDLLATIDVNSFDTNIPHTHGLSTLENFLFRHPPIFYTIPPIPYPLYPHP